MPVRPERSGDEGSIHRVHAGAFPSNAEARLVDALRDAGDLTCSWVAEENGRIVGHVAFSPVTLASGETGIGLAPVAVTAECRRRGIAAQLIEAGLEAVKAAGFGWAVVLGDPAYYARFGFRPAHLAGLSDEYGGGDAFQVMELAEGALPRDGGVVRYATAFRLVE